MANRKFEDITSSDSSDISSSVHYLPFKIEYEGAANVQPLFSETSRPHPDVDDVLTNRFRGRPLAGKNLEIPPEYEGVVLTDLKVSSALSVQHSEENDADTTEDRQPPVHITKRFNAMTYWNWDKPPSVMDAPVKLMDWLKLAEILHQPVTK